MVKSKFKKRILIILAMLAVLLSSVSIMSDSYKSTNASFFCSSMGSYMSVKSVGDLGGRVSNPDSNKREWTAEELFSQSVAFSSYYGEGPETFFHPDKEGRGEKYDGYDDIVPKLEESQSGCTWGFVLNTINNMMLGVAKIIVGLSGALIMSLVGRDPMSDVLTKIIGGDGSSTGLIGSFMDSFYMPLVVITALIMVVTIVYKGLIQFKMREALSSLIWTLGAFIIGVMLMLSPQLLVGIPQAATSTITTCVLGALSGQNCLSQDVAAPSMLASKECISSVANGNDSESVVNSMNCTVWKSFVLEPWAEAQFGAPYDELYTKDAPDDGGIWTNMPEGKEDKYCVSFNSSDSYTDSLKGKPHMDSSSNEICNVALYHLFLRTDVKDTGSQTGNNLTNKNVLKTDEAGEYDTRWYDIIIPMAQDDSRWKNWEGTDQLGTRVSTGFMSLLAITASSTVLMTLALFAGAYKVAGLILMAFAPVFFLFAIEPTRGRRIFLGWLESFTSAILKYFAITVLVVIALTMYAGLLENTSGLTSLIGVIILTFALHMYRKEIVDLIGAANMGGQRLSNKAAGVGNWAGKQAKEKGSAAVGGAVGGALGALRGRKDRIRSRDKSIDDLGEKLRQAEDNEDQEAIDFYQEQIETEKDLKSKEGGAVLGTAGSALKGSLSGGTESAARAFKRGTGVIANTAQQAGRTRSDLEAIDAKKHSERNKAIGAMNQNMALNKHSADRGDNSNSTPDNQVAPINVDGQDAGDTGKEVITKEEQVEITLDRMDVDKGEIEYTPDTTPVEREAYDNISDDIKNNYSDEELMRLMKDEVTATDPNMRAIASRHLNARIDAHHELGMDLGALSGATSLDRAESLDGYKVELDALRTQYDLTNDKNDLNRYMDGMSQMGVPPEELDSSYAQALKDNVMNMDNESYRNAVEMTVGSRNITAEELMKGLNVSNEDANDMMDVMAHEGIISEKTGDPEADKMRQVVATDMTEAKSLQQRQEAIKEARERGQDAEIQAEIKNKEEFVEEMRVERVAKAAEVEKVESTYNEALKELDDVNEASKKARQAESEAFRNRQINDTPESHAKYESAKETSDEITKQHVEVQSKISSAQSKLDKKQEEWKALEDDHFQVIRDNEANLSNVKKNVQSKKESSPIDNRFEHDEEPFKVEQEENNNNNNTRRRKSSRKQRQEKRQQKQSFDPINENYDKQFNDFDKQINNVDDELEIEYYNDGDDELEIEYYNENDDELEIEFYNEDDDK